jgi:aminopeptidase Y
VLDPDLRSKMKLNTVLFPGLLVSGTVATESLTADKLEADIHTDKLQNVLWNLNKIGRDNGNRAFGFPGYNASLDFILERVQTRFGKHFDTTVQSFVSLFATTNAISLTGPEGEDVRVDTLQYNNPTPDPEAGVTGTLVALPIDDERGSACFEDQWEGVNVDGQVALIKRGICPIADKLRFAKDRGAVGAVLINNVPGDAITQATLSGENYGTLAPVGVVTYEQGSAWYARVVAGESLEVTLVVDAVAEDRESWNIISETKEGDPDSVIFLGAHLDSVQQGPGVNDDGSGSAALLEIAGAIKKYTGFQNKVRFAWWGAEESGLIGSLYYTSQLSEAEADKIKFYFNYDMIGSIQPFYGIYADTEAHEVGGQLLVDYLSEQGFPAEYIPFGTSSDYVGFLQLGIPSSGIFTGAGAPEDPCYHLRCDNLDNIAWDAITVNTKAAARAIAEFALDASGIPAREKTSLNPKSRRGAAQDLTRLAALKAGLEKTHSCSGDAKRTV